MKTNLNAGLIIAKPRHHKAAANIMKRTAKQHEAVLADALAAAKAGELDAEDDCAVRRYLETAMRRRGLIALLLALLTLTFPALAGPPSEAPAGWERKVIASVILAEAGGEGAKGMESVYEVIWQRGVNRRISMLAVVTQRKQFSCLNRTTTTKLVQRMSQHPHYTWVHDRLLRFPPLTTHTCPAHLLELSTNRADHYHSVKVSPYWAKGQKAKRIGRHLFYRLRR